MAGARTQEPQAALAHKIVEADDPANYQLGQGFPRTYPATRLTAKGAHLRNGEMVAVDPGIQFFGPYVAVPAGRYLATLHATTLEGPGSVWLRVTASAGQQVLAERKVAVGAGVAVPLEVPFDVTAAKASKLEVVCTIEGMRGCCSRCRTTCT